MSEWFSNVVEEPTAKQGVVTEILCELPPKLPQSAETSKRRQIVTEALVEKVHGDDLRTFPPYFSGEGAISCQRRWLALQAATAKLDEAFEAFGRYRDHDDFQRLWVEFLAPHSPQRLLFDRRPETMQPLPNLRLTGSMTVPAPSATSAIPTLLLSTNGASMADRIDLYGAFASYLRKEQGAYVALLRPEDLAAGVGSCFSSAQAQLSGLSHSAAEDVMGLVAWYEHETGRGVQHALPQAVPGAAAEMVVDATPAKARPAKTLGRGRGAKAPGGRGKAPGGCGAPPLDIDGVAGNEAAEGTLVARLRARRGQQDQAAAVAVEQEIRAARVEVAIAQARNRQRHVVVLVEAAGRVTDRGSLRALLAALYCERHRLPVVLVLGLSCPAALYSSKLPADMAGLLHLKVAELAPYPLQLHRLFQDVLLAPKAPPPPLLLDGATMRELLLQSRLLEPSLACLQSALLEANQQHFRREPLAPLALLPLQQHQADKGAAAAAVRHQAVTAARHWKTSRGGEADNGDSSSDGKHDDSIEASPVSPASAGLHRDGESGGEELGAGPEGLAAMRDSWLDTRRQLHVARLEVAVSELPRELLRSVAPAVSDAKESGKAGGGQPPAQVGVACKAVSEAFSALSAWRLGLRWLTILAERCGAMQSAIRHRYMLPSLYVAAASPRFWKPPAAAVAAAVAASCAAETHAAGLNGTTVPAAVSLAAASLGEVLLAGVLGPTVGGGAATAGGGCGRGTTLRTLPEEELDLLLDHLMEEGREALLHDFLPSAAVLRAVKGVAELCINPNEAVEAGHRDAKEVLCNAHDSIKQQQSSLQQQQVIEGAGVPKGGVSTRSNGAKACGKSDGLEGGDEPDQTSPVRRRLASQSLRSPPTMEKIRGLVQRLGAMDPLPAPKLLQPNNAQLPQPQASRPRAMQTHRGAGPAAPPGSSAAGTTHASIKLPSSGQTQSKRQRDQALLSAVKQRAEAGPAVIAVVTSGEAGDQFTTTSSLENRVVEFLRTALRELLSTCPFQLPGSAAFTFRDAAGLQRRLVGAPSLALHTALTQPELVLKDLAPGIHPSQEDAALAYQLLVGCKEGCDLRDWLADFCAASGLGRMQEVRKTTEEEEEERGDVQEDGDGPQGRSRTSRRRQAPRKRKAAPRQEMVLTLDGPQAGAAVDALACRFEHVARELEAVGLCRYSKRRKGLYVHRTYFPPESVA